MSDEIKSMGSILEHLHINVGEDVEGIDFTEQNDEFIKQTEEKEKQRLYELSGVGKKYWNMRFENFDAYNDELKVNLQKVHSFIKDVQNGKSRTMWLCGNSGTGKTLLASLIIRECGGKFVKSYEIADEIEDCRSFKAEESKVQLIKRYSNYPVLVIDEVGKFEGKQWQELEYLFRILNERYEKEKSTIIVTNKTKVELKEYIGIPLFDRFVENCISAEFTSSSYRKNIKE